MCTLELRLQSRIEPIVPQPGCGGMFLNTGHARLTSPESAKPQSHGAGKVTSNPVVWLLGQTLRSLALHKSPMLTFTQRSSLMRGAPALCAGRSRVPGLSHSLACIPRNTKPPHPTPWRLRNSSIERFLYVCAGYLHTQCGNSRISI